MLTGLAELACVNRLILWRRRVRALALSTALAALAATWARDLHWWAFVACLAGATVVTFAYLQAISTPAAQARYIARNVERLRRVYVPGSNRPPP